MTIGRESIRVGVIGTGVMGGRHAENLHSRVVGARLAAIMDADAARAEEVASLCGSVPAFADAAELIRDEGIDAVLIASSDDSHAELVIECLRAEKPVLCEKPVATSLEDARRVVDAEVALGRRLVQVGFCRRYDRQHLAAKREVESGALGRARMYKGWHRNIMGPGGRLSNEMSLMGSAIHEFDSVRWLLGEEMEGVYVTGVNTDPSLGEEFLDLMLVQVSLTGGCLATWDVSQSAEYGYEVGFELVGERGTVTIGPPGPPAVRASASLSARIETHWLDRFGQAYLSEVQDWTSSVRRGGPTGPNAWDGYMSLLGAVYGIRSVESGEPQRIPAYERPALYRDE